MTSRELLDRALQRQQAGDLSQAEYLYGLVLHTEPAQIEALQGLGSIAAQQKKHAVALGYWDRVIRIQPDHAAAHTNRGSILQAQGKLPEAEACFREALRLKPDLENALRNLGAVLQSLGKQDEAATVFQRLAEAAPNDPEAQLRSAALLQSQGKFAEAERCYRELLRLRPGDVNVLNQLGYTLQEQQRLEEAAACYREAARLQPNFAFAHNNLGNVLTRLGKADEALLCYGAAIRSQPNYAEAYGNLGEVLKTQGRLEDAAICLQEAVRLRPDFVHARGSLADVLMTLGRLDEAREHYREVLRLKPDQATAYARLATLLHGKIADPELSAMTNVLAQPSLPQEQQCELHFALVGVHENRSNYAAAAEHARSGNALTQAIQQRRGWRWNEEAYVRSVDDLLRTFSPDFFTQMRGFGLDTERPIFVFGLPRSGTTLVEQILASHSHVFGAGELRYMYDSFEGLRRSPSADGQTRITPEALRQAAQMHLDRLSQLNADKSRIVDKMPDNYHLLGLIAALFPRAKLIHCRRDLRDIAVSCWTTSFTMLPWACDMDHIALWFRQYHRLMDHWGRVLPVSFLNVDYEELVANLEGVARQLVNWCGLEWEPACLSFHETARPIYTASVAQVRRPVYNRSVGRWRHYETALAPLLAKLPDDGRRENGR